MKITRSPDFVVRGVWVFYMEEMVQYNTQTDKWFPLVIENGQLCYILRNKVHYYKDLSDGNLNTDVQAFYKKYVDLMVEKELLNDNYSL